MIVVLGKGGQVGRALMAQLGTQAIGFDRDKIDLEKLDFISQLEGALKGQDISAVINAAAYTLVDKAEGEGCEAAHKINSKAVSILADWCKKRDVLLVHYSTDYVFDGSGNTPRKEDAPVAPLNEYGKSKLAGERAITQSGAKYLILRTSWVYDAKGANFFNTMRRLFRERETLNVVNDQIGAPTYAPHLAKATLKAISNASISSGIYHLTAAGETSWFDFAKAIFALASDHEKGLKCTSIQPIASAAYPTPAKRPLNSRLDCSKFVNTFGASLPNWQVGLKECIDDAYGSNRNTDQGTQAHQA
jgi:dTDP-4-dehydrorhamnose reductase